MKILAHPDAHSNFGIWGGLIWIKNQLKCDVVCVPRNAFKRGRRLIEIIIDHTHQIIGHYGQWKMVNYIWHLYWWPKYRGLLHNMKKVSNKQNRDAEVTRASTQPAHPRQAVPSEWTLWDPYCKEFLSVVARLH